MNLFEKTFEYLKKYFKKAEVNLGYNGIRTILNVPFNIQYNYYSDTLYLDGNIKTSFEELKQIFNKNDTVKQIINEENKKEMKKNIFIVIIATIVALLILLYASCAKIPNKHIGLEYSFGGKYLRTINEEGLLITNPFTNVKKVSLKNQQKDFVIEKYAKDGVLRLSFVSQVRVNPDKVIELLNENVIDPNTLIVSYFAESTEKIISQYNIIDIMGKRTEITNDIKEEVLNKLKNQNYFYISNIILTDIDFPEAVERSLQERVLTNQQVEKEKSKTFIIEEQNKQKLIEAKAEAEAMRIKNEALKNNQEIIKLQFIEKWNGVLPTTITNDVMKVLQ